MQAQELLSPDTRDLSRAAKKLGAINGFRGFAILLVITHHLFVPYYGPDTAAHPATPQIEFVGAFIRSCARGVDIFFVLSGFVLYLPYAENRRRFNGWRAVREFYWHRAARLLPLFWLVVIVGMTFHPMNPIASTKWFIETSGLITTLFVFSPHGFMPPSNIVLWSVGVEIWFSLLFPFLVLAIQRIEVRNLAIIVTATSFIFSMLGVMIHIDRVGQFLPFTNGVFGKAFEFVLGMYVAERFTRNPEQSRASPRALLHQMFGFIGCTLAVILHEVYFEDPWIRPVDSTLFATFFAILLLNTISSPSSIRTFISTWPIQIVGCMCYSIYAWHGIVLNTVIPTGTSLSSTWREMPLFLILTATIATLTYRFVEFGRASDTRALFLLSPKSQNS